MLYSCGKFLGDLFSLSYLASLCLLASGVLSMSYLCSGNNSCTVMSIDPLVIDENKVIMANTKPVVF